MYWYYGKVMYSTGIVVTSPQDHWRIIVRQMVELERDYGYLGQEKIFGTNEKKENRKRSKLSEILGTVTVREKIR